MLRLAFLNYYKQPLVIFLLSVRLAFLNYYKQPLVVFLLSACWDLPFWIITSNHWLYFCLVRDLPSWIITSNHWLYFCSVHAFLNIVLSFNVHITSLLVMTRPSNVEQTWSKRGRQVREYCDANVLDNLWYRNAHMEIWLRVMWLAYK